MGPWHGWHKTCCVKGYGQVFAPVSGKGHSNCTAQNLPGSQLGAWGLLQRATAPALFAKVTWGGLDPQPRAAPTGPIPRVALTGTDDGQVLHVAQKPVDGGAGAWVEPVPADAQVELEPAGLWAEQQWGCRGGEVQFLPVKLVSPGKKWLQRGEDEPWDGNPEAVAEWGGC